MSSPADPRTEYRQHMQRQQTTVIGTLLAVMAGMVVIGLLVWTGIIPVKGPGFSRDEATEAYTPPACPPANSKTVELTSLVIKIYNGSQTVGLAGTVETTLTDAGMTVEDSGDWSDDYGGNVKILTSEPGLVNAYSLAQVFPNSTVLLDPKQNPADLTVSVVLGAEYAHTMLTTDEIGLINADQAIVPPSGCVAATSAASEGASAGSSEG